MHILNYRLLVVELPLELLLDELLLDELLDEERDTDVLLLFDELPLELLGLS